MTLAESLHPSIPRIQCPRCGILMRLAKVEPEANDSHSSRMTLECQCGFAYHQSERARSEAGSE
jgi:RNase P subunit RPR2